VATGHVSWWESTWHHVIAWDGVGGAADSIFDYTPGLPAALDETNVDALANIHDLLYDEVSHLDLVTMLTSFTGHGDVHYTTAARRRTR